MNLKVYVFQRNRVPPLLACHIDLTNAFWSLSLPEPYKNSFRVRIDGKSYAFSCLPFGWRCSPATCQHVLAFVTGSVDTSGVVVLHYLDDFLVIGYGKAKVGSVSQRLCDALRKAGAVISTKSVLEPVPEIQWLGKWLVLSGDGAVVFPKGQGGAALLGLWIRAAVLPLTRKHARRILGRFIWSLRPTVGFAPFLSGWWAHCQWGPIGSKTAPCPWSRASCTASCFPIGLGNHRYCFPLASVGGGVLYVDATFDVDKFKVGVWGPTLGGRVFPCSPGVRTQQEAELEALVCGVRLCIRVG